MSDKIYRGQEENEPSALVFVFRDAPSQNLKAIAEAARRKYAPRAIVHGNNYERLEGVECSQSSFEEIRKAAGREFCDVFLVPEKFPFSGIEALFFDMDSTLVSTETLDEMAAIHGLGAQCAQITKDVMEGRIKDYPASLRARVALLKGLSASSIEKVWADMRPNPGVQEWIRFCSAHGKKTYVVSSGFTVLAGRMAEKLGMTGLHTNVIGIDGDTLTGRYTGEVSGMDGGPIMDGNGKAQFVRDECARLGISPRQALCAGDGSNDIAMIDLAGVGVGFRPKAVLRPHCDVCIDFAGMDALEAVFSDIAGRKAGPNPELC